MRVRFSPAAFMPRSRKTSTQPKKKVKKFVDKPKPVYPDFIQKFIDDVESKTPFKVRIDQYNSDGLHDVSVLQKRGKVYHCIWAVGMVNKQEYLNMFWVSDLYKNWKTSNV